MNYKDYFDSKISEPTKYNYGDRVFSKFSGIPLVGMVIRETEKMVLIHADLPLKIEDEIRHIVWCPVKSVKKLVVLQD